MTAHDGSHILSAISTARNLKRRRKERKMSRFDVSERAGISPSFYSELELGRKSASGETLRRVTKALDMGLDELQSDHYDAALEALLDFQDHDIAIKEGIELLDKAPHLAKAIPRLLTNIARVSDRGSKQEVIYPILLRDFQEEHFNYFPDLEREAKAFLAEHPPRGISPDRHDLQGILRYVYKYTIKSDHDFHEQQYQHLPIIRSMWLRQGKQQHLLLNRHLLESQKTFELAREIAYNLPFLRHKETLAHRVPTSPHVGIHSYTQILNEFKASYFAGAVLMPQEPLEADVAAWFQQQTFDKERLWDMLTTYNVTPEMLLHRLTEILPGNALASSACIFSALNTIAPAPGRAGLARLPSQQVAQSGVPALCLWRVVQRKILPPQQCHAGLARDAPGPGNGPCHRSRPVCQADDPRATLPFCQRGLSRQHLSLHYHGTPVGVTTRYSLQRYDWLCGGRAFAAHGALLGRYHAHRACGARGRRGRPYLPALSLKRRSLFGPRCGSSDFPGGSAPAGDAALDEQTAQKLLSERV